MGKLTAIINPVKMRLRKNMDKKDLKKIREEVASVIEDNVNPQFDELNGRIDKIESKLGGRMDRLEDDVVSIKSQMVTKAYLDEKMADLSGDVIVRLKKEDAKVNRLIEMMGSKKVLNRQEVKELEGFKIFPRPAN